MACTIEMAAGLMGSLTGKKCSGCETVKPLYRFGVRLSGLRACRSRCKECEAANRREWVRLDPDKAKECSERWNRRNPEKRRAYATAYNRSHKKEQAAYDRDRRQREPEKCAAIEKASKERNREKIRATQKTYQKLNRASIRLVERKWYLLNRERKNATFRVWASKNRKKLAASASLYRRRHPEKVAAGKIAWAKNNPEQCRILRNRRRSRSASLPATFTTDQWEACLADHNYQCAYCGVDMIFAGHLAQDHCVPVVHGGGYVIGNIIPACQPCNSRKSSKTTCEYIWATARIER